MSKPPTPRSGGLFPDSHSNEIKAVAMFRANIDGGSRGNPGPASYGVVIRDPSGEIVAKLKKYIGRTTNNVAEYYGLIAALDYAQAQNIRALRIESDSELLVKQMRGQYKVKSEDLRPLFERAKKMVGGLANFRIEHVYREQNRDADLLANEAMDESAGIAPSATPAETKRGVVGGDAAKIEPRKLRGVYKDGAIHLEAPIDLPENTAVELLLRTAKK